MRRIEEDSDHDLSDASTTSDTFSESSSDESSPEIVSHLGDPFLRHKILKGIWQNIHMNPLLESITWRGKPHGPDPEYGRLMLMPEYPMETIWRLNKLPSQLPDWQQQSLKALWHSMFVTWPPVEYVDVFPSRERTRKLHNSHGFNLSDFEYYARQYKPRKLPATMRSRSRWSGSFIIEMYTTMAFRRRFVDDNGVLARVTEVRSRQHGDGMESEEEDEMESEEDDEMESEEEDEMEIEEEDEMESEEEDEMESDIRPWRDVLTITI